MNLREVADEALKENRNERAADVILSILREHDGDGVAASVSAEDAGILDMMKHDKRFHGGQFKEGEMQCSLREKLSKSDNPDADLAKHDSVMAGLSNKKAEEYLRLMRKNCPQLDPEETLEQIASIDDPKMQGDAFRWLMKGAVRLPEDMYKVKEARNLADKAKKDPMSYDTPQACINDLSGQFKRGSDAKINPIDPDTVPELSDKKVMSMGVTTYLVQDDRDGQQAMREIINTHWGKDANPWCLLHGDGNGELSDGTDGDYDAWHYWHNVYTALPKRVAFKDGKLLAFMATDVEPSDSTSVDEEEIRKLNPDLAEEFDNTDFSTSYIPPTFIDWMIENHPDKVSGIGEEWWDRQDSSHEGIPVGLVYPKGDKRAMPNEVEIMNDGSVKHEPVEEVGKRCEKGYRKWDTYTKFLKEAITDVDKDGNVVGMEVYNDGGFPVKILDDDLLVELYGSHDSFGDRSSVSISKAIDGDRENDEMAVFDANGELKHIEALDYRFEVTKDGLLKSETPHDFVLYYDKNGNYVKAEAWDRNDELVPISQYMENASVKDRADFMNDKDDIGSFVGDALKVAEFGRKNLATSMKKMFSLAQGNSAMYAPSKWREIGRNSNDNGVEKQYRKALSEHLAS